MADEPLTFHNQRAVRSPHSILHHLDPPPPTFRTVVVQWVSNTSAPTPVGYGFIKGGPYKYTALSSASR
jgi:hypothetical protein